MADTVNEYVLSKKSDLVSIADAVRTKLGSSENVALSALASLVSNIETGGGTDEILSMFGANTCEIVENTKGVSDYDNVRLSTNLANNSVDDVKLVISIDNNYLAGISPTGPSSTGGGPALMYICLQVNNLNCSVVYTTSALKSSSVKSEGISIGQYDRRKLSFPSVVSATSIVYSNPMTTLIIYNAA